jgi:hypothetical protein
MLLFNEEGAASVSEIRPRPQFAGRDLAGKVVANRSIRVATYVGLKINTYSVSFV